MKIQCEEVKFSDLLGFLGKRIDRLDWLKGSGKATERVDALTEAGSNLAEEKPPKDAVHAMYQAGLSLWEQLYPAAIQKIDFDIRGIGELKTYTHRFARFEDLIYNADDRYRDHILHSLWVYCLGERFAEKFTALRFDPLYIPFFCAETRKGAKGRVDGVPEMQTITESLFKNSKIDATTVSRPHSWYDGLENLYDKRDAVWAAAALLHDIGYPLARVMRIEDEIRKTLQSYGPFYPSELAVHWSPIQVQSVSRFVDFSSENLAYDGSCADLLGGRLHGQARIESEPFLTSLVSKSIEDRDHGVLGAYLLYRLTRSFKRLYESRVLEDADHWWFTMSLAKGAILRAITGHTIPVYRYDFFPQFGAYLFLMDELEDGLRFYKVPGEKRYLVSAFSTFFGVAKGTFDERKGVLVMGIRVVDNSSTTTGAKGLKEIAIKSFAHRFSRFFHLFNSERVSQQTPVVVHFEYWQGESKFVGEAKFLSPTVKIFLEDCSPSPENWSAPEHIEKLFEREGLDLAQPWAPTKEPSVDLNTQ